MKIVARIRRIGNSLGIVIPRSSVDMAELKEGDFVQVEVIGHVNLREMFGSIKFRKSTQELKDGLRPKKF